MPYIGHNPTQAGSFVLLDDIASGFDGDDVTFTLQIGGVDITPTADNLIIALDGVIQHSPEAYTVSGSTLTFATGPASGVDFYGMLMGQSASIGQGAIGADELSVTGDGSANQMLVSDGDGTMTWKGSGLSATSATGDIIYRNSSGELARLAVGSAGQVLTVASGVPAWETDVESYLPLSGGTMSGALNMGSQAITNAGTITGTFSGNLTGNVTGNTSGTAASVTGASQGSITSVGTLTGLSVNSSVDGNWVAQIKNTDADNGYGLYVAAGDDASVKSFCVANKDDSDKFYVTGDGNATFAGTVLISQSGSETPLHIKNTNTGAGQNCYLKIENDGGADTYLNFLQGSSNGYIKYTDEGDMIFQTAGMNNRLSIDSSGATFAGDVTISNSIPLLYMNDTSGAKNNQIFFQAGGTSYFRIGTDITTNNGTEALEITDGGGSNARLTINSSGNSIFGGTIQSTGSITLGSAGSHSNLLWIASTNGTADIVMDI